MNTEIETWKLILENCFPMVRVEYRVGCFHLTFGVPEKYSSFSVTLSMLESVEDLDILFITLDDQMNHSIKRLISEMFVEKYKESPYFTTLMNGTLARIVGDICVEPNKPIVLLHPLDYMSLIHHDTTVIDRLDSWKERYKNDK